MIENLLAHKNYIHAFYNVHYENNSIGDFDRAVLNGLYDIFGDFKNATTWLSGVYYSTSPLVLNQLFILACKISAYEDKRDWGNLMASMKKKLLKYFKDIPFLFFVPRR